MLAQFALALYGSAGTLSSPALRWLVRHRLQRGKEHPSRFKERFGQAGLSRPAGPLFWLHAASVGEATSLLPLIDRLRTEMAQVSLLLTTTTVTSADLITPKLPSRALHQFAPYDTPVWTRRFLDHWHPDVGILVESEIWPNILSQASARNIPLLLVNGRISARAATAWSRLPALARWTFGLFTKVLSQSPEDARRLQQLGARDVAYVGNLRFSAPPLSADPAVLEQEESHFTGRKIWVAASTHAGEEELIARAHKEIATRCPGLITIITPRHPNRAPTIIDSLKDLDLRVAVRSSGHTVTPETDIYLADTFDELGIWLRLARVAFVGGSLVPLGGHNPLEAARLNCAVICGPHMENQAVPVSSLQSADALTIVRSKNDLVQEVLALLHDPEACDRKARAAAECAETEAGACERIFAALKPTLESSLSKQTENALA